MYNLDIKGTLSALETVSVLPFSSLKRFMRLYQFPSRIIVDTNDRYIYE